MELETIIVTVNYFGVVTAAVSGSLFAARKRMDIVGFCVLATASGLGGGIVRDVLLNVPVFFLAKPEYLVVCILTALVVFCFAKNTTPSKVLIWADACSISAFTVTGTEKALLADCIPIIAAVMGVITASFGGVLCGILSKEIPLILRKEIYASASLCGALIYVALQSSVQISSVILMFISFSSTLIIRGLGIIYSLNLPRFGEKKALIRLSRKCSY